VKPTRQPREKKISKVIVFDYCMNIKEQQFDLLHLSTKEILNKDYKHKIISMH
jgi:inorganic pyrophosphatase/exopolyphosphatase